MKNPVRFRVFFLLFIITVSCKTEISDFASIDRAPEISPDYSGIVIPPNISPMNFKINEPGSQYQVRVSVNQEVQFTVKSNNPVIRFDLRKWHKMLEDNKGEKLSVDIFVKGSDEKWMKFNTITNVISNDSIDGHLAYRLINTGYVFWSKLGIYQRNLENFEEKAILENKSFDYGCLNCHSFCTNDPDKMLIHIRAVHGGTILVKDGILSKINTKSDYTLNAGVYPSWHPDGIHIAFSVNNINQHFCNGETRIEVSDELSDLIVYDTETNTITTSAKVSTSARENLPVWSPDGKFLYFISAPPFSSLDERIQARYDLLRIGFDAKTNAWGSVDTVIASRKFGKSISFPKVSPNGKFLIFSASEFGYFTIHHADADLYILNLETGDIKTMEINSSQTDSYHGFSKSGKWFVFSSKRMDGLFTRPYFSYLDENGNASKPFVLPQEDPGFYDNFIQNYNIPELITGEVNVSSLAIRDKVLEDAIPAKIDALTDTAWLKQHLATQGK